MPAYLTTIEFQNFPTDVDTTTLVPGGSVAQQTQALLRAINAASGWIEGKCQQILVATVDIETKRARPSRDGFLYIKPDNFPVISVSSFQVDLGRAGAPVWNAVPLTCIELLSEGPVSPKRFGVRQDFSSGFGLGSPDLRAQYTYVNGYVNTTLQANLAPGAATLTVANGAGITAGKTYTIDDGDKTEQVTVATAYVSGSTTVPLTAPTQFAHNTPPTAVHAMPPAIKEACALVTSHFIKSPRGSKSMVVGTTGAKPGGAGTRSEVLLERAEELIQPWIRKW